MIINDDFNNYKKYNIPKADLILTDIPYCIGLNAYASNRSWWKDGNVANGNSKRAKTEFFSGEGQFDIDQFLDFCKNNLKENGSVIVWCSHLQQFEIISKMKKYGFKKYIPLVFIKNNSAETLKVNMRIVGACEYGLQLIQNRLPAFYNNRKMIKNWFNMKTQYFSVKKLHPNQKPDDLLEQFIQLYTKEGDVVIDCCAGSGSTMVACKKLNRNFIGIEINNEYFKIAESRINSINNENKNEMFDL